MSNVDTFEWSKIVEAFAVNARIEGMKAANDLAAVAGRGQDFHYTDFIAEATTLDSISGLLLERSRYG